MSPMPESGTSARNATRVATGLAAYGEPVAAAASIVGPAMAGKLLMSRPIQQLLMSAPENARAALTALIAAGQMRDRPEARR
jgi:hypothetical protein